VYRRGPSSSSRSSASRAPPDPVEPLVADDEQVGVLPPDDVEQRLDRGAHDRDRADLPRAGRRGPLAGAAHGVLGRVRAHDLVGVLPEGVLRAGELAVVGLGRQVGAGHHEGGAAGTGEGSGAGDRAQRRLRAVGADDDGAVGDLGHASSSLG
jgi:hypothetical protein